ncbi:MAG: efflux RND transporter periplasmic adaptor subunit, partial [Betaproteobacteria bacterium]
SFLSQEVTADQQKPVMAVNPDAVVERNGKSVVLVIRDNVANEVAVNRGATLGDLVAVTGELKIGDKIVQKPAEGLHNGSLVKVEAK